MTEEPDEKRGSWARRGGIAVVLALVALALGYGLYRFIQNASGPKRPVQEIVTLKLIQPPPPPPPPPPPQMPKPPEPQKMVEQPPEQKPMQRAKPAENKPPPQPLALDAKGGPGSDSFGLAGRPGGSDLIGGDGGGGTSRFGWYADIVQNQIQQALQKDEKLRSGEYRIVVSVWLSSDGRPTKVKLIHSTGDHAVDSRIEKMLASLPALPQAPPHDMPQPVDLRIDAQATH